MELNKIKNRYEWIDLARGLGMLYIVSLHTQGFFSYPGAYISYMSLFFILSGLLFNNEHSIIIIIKNKINKLLVPFLLYYLLGYFCFYILQIIFPNYLSYTDASESAVRAKGILDVFTQRQYFDGPIWFILCLFWCEMYFILIIKFIHKYIVPFVVLLGGAIGWILGKNNIFLPMMMDTALTVLPLLYFGFLLRKVNFLNTKLSWKSAVLFLLSVLVSSYIVYKFNPGIHLHYNHPHGNPILLILLSVSASMAIMLGAKFLCAIPLGKIPHFPAIRYFGANSITPLGMHHMIFRPLIVLGIQLGNTLFVVTTVLCYLSIPIVNNVLPWMAGKKSILK